MHSAKKFEPEPATELHRYCSLGKGEGLHPLRQYNMARLTSLTGWRPFDALEKNATAVDSIRRPDRLIFLAIVFRLLLITIFSKR